MRIQAPLSQTPNCAPSVLMNSKRGVARVRPGTAACPRPRGDAETPEPPGVRPRSDRDSARRAGASEVRCRAGGLARARGAAAGRGRGSGRDEGDACASSKLFSGTAPSKVSWALRLSQLFTLLESWFQKETRLFSCPTRRMFGGGARHTGPIRKKRHPRRTPEVDPWLYRSLSRAVCAGFP